MDITELNCSRHLSAWYSCFAKAKSTLGLGFPRVFSGRKNMQPVIRFALLNDVEDSLVFGVHAYE